MSVGSQTPSKLSQPLVENLVLWQSRLAKTRELFIQFNARKK